eukprot:1945954-Pleurochrysis_carterae.AAC.1
MQVVGVIHSSETTGLLPSSYDSNEHTAPILSDSYTSRIRNLALAPSTSHESSALRLYSQAVTVPSLKLDLNEARCQTSCKPYSQPCAGT